MRPNPPCRQHRAASPPRFAAADLRLDRRAVLTGALASGALLYFRPLARAGEGGAVVDLDAVRRIAQEPAPQPAELKRLSYDQWRQIRFRPDRTVWLDDPSPFKLQFFHPGFLQQGRVEIELVDGSRATPLRFDRTMFDYGELSLPDAIWSAVGYAGFRVHHELGDGNPLDEVLVFLGASYFRAIGKGQAYGLSARGLAIDTGLPEGEEFPFFRRFWIVKPTAESTAIVIYALLDSQSVTGAYRFTVRPGTATTLEIEAEVYPRRPVKKLGIAPLTSMFLFGEAGTPPVQDFRPEVHDSDGLRLQNGDGERIWRPLVNPRRLSTAAFRLTDPRSIALLQRDRNFDHYQDLESRYQLRPSAWVEPAGGWGEGRVELVQIPADREIYDNIVSLWVPGDAVAAGKAIAFGYRLSWTLDAPADHASGRAVATRFAPYAGRAGTRCIVDFAGDGGRLAAAERLEGVVTASGAAIANIVTEPNSYIDGARLAFDVAPSSSAPVELRAFLRERGEALSETWSFAWQT